MVFGSSGQDNNKNKRRQQQEFQQQHDRQKSTDLRSQQSQTEFKNAYTGTKTIYFDANDNMYTETEIQSKEVKTKLTPMVVKLPDQERLRLLQEQKKSRTRGLEEFCQQIKSSKTEFNHQKRLNLEYKRSGYKVPSLSKNHSSAHLSSTSGDSRKYPNLEPRHFNNKESNVWLNMFETIS